MRFFLLSHVESFFVRCDLVYYSEIIINGDKALKKINNYQINHSVKFNSIKFKMLLFMFFKIK
jgi:hypothetical protein